jgi:transcriptional regulator with XRE-family HTH domain
VVTETETPSLTIAQTVRQRRRQLGLSQADAAHQAGISRRAWSELENGRRRGSPDTLAKVEAVLQMSPPGVLSALEVRPNGDELAALKRQFIEMINKLTTKEQVEAGMLDLAQRELKSAQDQLDKLRQELLGGRADDASQPPRNQR